MTRLFTVLFLLLVGCGDDSEVGDDLNQTVAVSIVSGPFDAVAYEGGVAAFSVSAVGSELRYQWYRSGVAITGANSAQLEVAATAANVGVAYYCVLTNSKNESKSTVPVGLTLIPQPSIVRNGGMVRIPVDSFPFVMGSVSAEAVGAEGPIHQVKLNHSFWMDSIPVSEKKYSEIMQKNHPTTHYAMPWGANSRSDIPATSVSWYDALLYVNALSRAEGLDSTARYKVLVKLDTRDGVLNLADSLLTYKRFTSDTTVRVIVQDSIAIVPADTSDIVVGKTLRRTIYPVDTIKIVPNKGYELRELNLDGPDYAVKYDTVLTELNDTVETLVVTHLLAGSSETAKVVDTIVAQIVDTSYVAKIDSGSVNRTKRFRGYRLPTEAEWEFACRSRFGSDRYWADKLQWAEYAHGYTGGVPEIQPLGLKKPNLYGLYDMIGLVWEWCSDFYASYTAVEAVDPRGPVIGTRRVQRGGSYGDLPVYLRSSQRGSAIADSKSAVVGFRVVRDAE